MKLAFSIVYRPVFASKQIYLMYLNQKHKQACQHEKNCELIYGEISSKNMQRNKRLTRIIDYIFPFAFILWGLIVIIAAYWY